MKCQVETSTLGEKKDENRAIGGAILYRMLRESLSDKQKLREVRERIRGISKEEHYRQVQRP